MLGDALGGEEWLDEPAAPSSARVGNGRRKAVARQATRRTAAAGPPRSFSLRVPRALVAGVAVVAIVAVLAVGYNFGGGTVPGLTGTPDPGPTGPVVDQAQVSAYMTRLAADAEDIEAMQGLANLYFAAGDFATAGLWLDKLLAVDPDNVSALLGAGAVAYNVADLEAAETAWMRVVELDPDNVEVHYDLGFLYLAQDPPNTEMVRQEWQKVIELEPDGAFAKTVAGHLDSLAPAASGSPAPSNDAAATPAASAPADATPAATPTTAPAASPGG
jgi:tetratricopeptide (TPR) repeat protein